MKTLKKYFELKTQIKELTAELKEIDGDVFEQVSDEENNKLETDFCRFQIVYRPKWEYTEGTTEKIKLVQDKIKIMKKQEEIDGSAIKISDGGQLRMTDRK